MADPRAPALQKRYPHQAGGKRRKPEPETRLCAAPGLRQARQLPRPKSRENLSEYFWFCAAHARAHNESWDFFKGMGDGDIQKFREEAVTGHRPTWPMGKRAARARTGQGPLAVS